MSRVKKPKLKYVYRANYPAEHINGYIAKITRKSGRLFKVFQLADYDNNHEKAKKAAAKVAVKFDRECPKLSRWQIAEMKRPKKNPSLPSGVRIVIKNVKGKDYKFFEASWSPKPNQTAKKLFSVGKYKFAGAKALAIQQRLEWIETIAD